MSAWQNRFKDHTTNVAFNLQLSRNMIRALVVAKTYEESTLAAGKMAMNFGMSVPSMRCLINRGLIEHHDKPDDYLSWDFIKQCEFEATHRWYTLTPAGKCVYELCILAGLITEDIPASNEVAA